MILKKIKIVPYVVVLLVKPTSCDWPNIFQKWPKKGQNVTINTKETNCRINISKLKNLYTKTLNQLKYPELNLNRKK